MHCNLSDEKMHASYIRPCINKKKNLLVAQSDALQSFAFLLHNSLNNSISLNDWWKLT